ncbi:hypothetical protein [Bifidobacterium sp. SO1]|uniref:hypothetical protein n=1 Tax=Bifidobacterium sp. SO1 TaxID=2809029 RepID=UPI001BDC8790|nr:hypothetical protein [Bifidobacterium sp. SO1]MBT1162745.1 hypothetical protein [Bifidobacterium sp. SO1]
MDERLKRPIAATMTAITLMGGMTATAMADDTTMRNPTGDSGEHKDTGDAQTTYERSQLKDTRIVAHTDDDGTGRGTILDIDPSTDDEGETPNATLRFDVTGLPDGWTSTVGENNEDEWTIIISTPDKGIPQSWRLTIRRAAADRTVTEAFSKTLTDAKDILDHGADAYAKPGLDTLKNQYDRAAAIDAKHATKTLLETWTGTLTRAIDALTVTNWTFQGKDFDAKGAWSGGEWKPDGEPSAKDLTITGGLKGHERTLNPTVGKDTTVMNVLGITEHAASYTATTPDGATLTIPVSYRTGTEITIPVKDKDPIRFVKDGTGFKATLPQDTLNRDNTIPDALKTVTLSDGSKLTLQWDAPHVARSEASARFWLAEATTRDATVAGQPVTVTMSAARAYDPTLTVALERRDSKGESREITLPDGVFKDLTDVKDATITAPMLPYEAIGDQYTAKTVTGVDVTADVTNGLGDNGERVFTVKATVTGEDGKTMTRTITIRQPFDKAIRKTENPNAALESINVNGKTIQGWDPDILDYTISAGEHDRVTVGPVARDGQTVKASDATQTAYTTVQHWTVTASDGSSRTYTVTLVRDHKTPTADEAFTPKDATDTGGTADAPSESETGVKSVGWLLDGDYHRADKDSYTIPEGGSFAYETWKGQTVRVQSGRVKGMTWRYTLGVLAPDHHSYASHEYEVTYVTAATSKAELTGISVDGKPVKGFKPDTLEYEVSVNDPNRYVTTAQWDKPTGMSVTKHADGTVTTLTATSADGLHSRTYTVKAKRTVLDAAAETLAETGSTIRVALVGVIILTLAGAAVALAAHFRRRKADDDATVADTPSNEGTEE